MTPPPRHAAAVTKDDSLPEEEKNPLSSSSSCIANQSGKHAVAVAAAKGTLQRAGRAATTMSASASSSSKRLLNKANHPQEKNNDEGEADDGEEEEEDEETDPMIEIQDEDEEERFANVDDTLATTTATVDSVKSKKKQQQISTKKDDERPMKRARSSVEKNSKNNKKTKNKKTDGEEESSHHHHHHHHHPSTTKDRSPHHDAHQEEDASQDKATVASGAAGQDATTTTLAAAAASSSSSSSHGHHHHHHHNNNNNKNNNNNNISTSSHASTSNSSTNVVYRWLDTGELASDGRLMHQAIELTVSSFVGTTVAGPTNSTDSASSSSSSSPPPRHMVFVVRPNDTVRLWSQGSGNNNTNRSNKEEDGDNDEPKKNDDNDDNDNNTSAWDNQWIARVTQLWEMPGPMRSLPHCRVRWFYTETQVESILPPLVPLNSEHDNDNDDNNSDSDNKKHTPQGRNQAFWQRPHLRLPVVDSTKAMTSMPVRTLVLSDQYDDNDIGAIQSPFYVHFQAPTETQVPTAFYSKKTLTYRGEDKVNDDDDNDDDDDGAKEEDPNQNAAICRFVLQTTTKKTTTKSSSSSSKRSGRNDNPDEDDEEEQQQQQEEQDDDDEEEEETMPWRVLPWSESMDQNEDPDFEKGENNNDNDDDQEDEEEDDNDDDDNERDERGRRHKANAALGRLARSMESVSSRQSESSLEGGMEEEMEDDDDMDEDDDEENERAQAEQNVIPEGEGSQLRSDIQVGDLHQVSVGPFVPPGQAGAATVKSRNPKLIWTRNKLSNQTLQEFLDKLAPMHTAFLKENGLTMEEPYSPLPTDQQEEEMMRLMESPAAAAMSPYPHNHRPMLTGSSISTAGCLAATPADTPRSVHRNGLLKECNVDAVLEILHENKYDTEAALTACRKDFNRITTAWTRSEKEVFDAAFRGQATVTPLSVSAASSSSVAAAPSMTASLRMIAAAVHTKTHKDVIDYWFRFKIADQFRLYQNKKREQAIRMVECIEKRRYHEFVTGVSTIAVTDRDNGRLESAAVPPHHHHHHHHHHKSTGRHFSETATHQVVGAAEARRQAAKCLLLDVQKAMGNQVMQQVAATVRELSKSYSSAMKNELFLLLKGQDQLQQRFLEFLPKNV